MRKVRVVRVLIQSVFLFFYLHNMHKIDLYFYLRKYGVRKHHALAYASLWCTDSPRMSEQNFFEITRAPPAHPK